MLPNSPTTNPKNQGAEVLDPPINGQFFFFRFGGVGHSLLSDPNDCQAFELYFLGFLGEGLSKIIQSSRICIGVKRSKSSIPSSKYTFWRDVFKEPEKATKSPQEDFFKGVQGKHRFSRMFGIRLEDSQVLWSRFVFKKFHHMLSVIVVLSAVYRFKRGFFHKKGDN